MPTCLIGLGSNQGDRRGMLEAAVARLAGHPEIAGLSHSSWRETRPAGGPADQPRFLNGAAKLETALRPEELLALLVHIEEQLGRRRGTRWGPRMIDLDLLLYDELVLDTPSLVLPHPRMAWRRFVLEPAAEIAPSLRHPTTGWTLARLLDHLNQSAPYLAVTGPIAAGKTDLAVRLGAALSANVLLEEPDWAHLDDFYADPAGKGWAMELEFLSERAGLLARDRPVWSSGAGWSAISGSTNRPRLPRRGSHRGCCRTSSGGTASFGSRSRPPGSPCCWTGQPTSCWLASAAADGLAKDA